MPTRKNPLAPACDPLADSFAGARESLRQVKQFADELDATLSPSVAALRACVPSFRGTPLPRVRPFRVAPLVIVVTPREEGG